MQAATSDERVAEARRRNRKAPALQNDFAGVADPIEERHGMAPAPAVVGEHDAPAACGPTENQAEIWAGEVSGVTPWRIFPGVRRRMIRHGGTRLDFEPS